MSAAAVKQKELPSLVARKCDIELSIVLAAALSMPLPPTAIARLTAHSARHLLAAGRDL